MGGGRGIGTPRSEGRGNRRIMVKKRVRGEGRSTEGRE